MNSAPPPTGRTIRAFANARPGKLAAGFSLVEIAIVIVVIGLVAALSMGAFSGALGGREIKTASALAQGIDGAILAYARSKNRLPCPDANGDGWEDGAPGPCPAGLEIGYVPYESIGVQSPATAERAIYAVYRNAGITADLVAPATATRVDFLRAMARGATAAVTTSHVYVTGENGATGAENCAGNQVFHPAFAVIVPGSDRDGDGSRLDGIDAVLPGTGKCLASPDRAPDTVFDDRVVSTGFTTLLGLISTDAP